jgi:hypothetical protein
MLGFIGAAKERMGGRIQGFPANAKVGVMAALHQLKYLPRLGVGEVGSNLFNILGAPYDGYLLALGKVLVNVYLGHGSLPQ